MKTALLSLSGGMDSATLLGVLIDEGYEINCIGFFYGSKHGTWEMAAAMKTAKHYDVPYEVVNLTEVFGKIKSNLLTSGGVIPEGHYEEKTMETTVVPGRNMIFISILAGIAASRGVREVYVGVHSGDHAIYPDCRPQFISAMKPAVWRATGSSLKGVQLVTPFLYKDKGSILEEGLQLKVPYELTRTCYKDQPVACGRCGSCQERLEGFARNDVADPIMYETREILPKKECDESPVSGEESKR